MEKKTTNWWDKLGEPQYGDEMVIRVERDIVNFDPYFTEGLTEHLRRLAGKAGLRRLDAGPGESGILQLAWHPAKYHEEATWRKAGNFRHRAPMSYICARECTGRNCPAGQRPGIQLPTM